MKKFITCVLVILGSISLTFSQDLYDISTITQIEITFDESNWDAILDNYYSKDEDEELMGSVIINDVEFDSIGVRFKGNSTYNANNSKNPLHISLDYAIDDQNYDGYETLKLSNGQNDPSFVREVLSYEIIRKYMDAPLSNYAMVYINESYYGMFSSSEAINSDFTENELSADKDNTRIKCNPEDTNFGNGPSLEYLGSDSTDYYVYYDMKSDYGWQDLIDLTYDLDYNASDIESALDIDRAIWMVALNNVLVNLDSYIGIYHQNYYMITDDNDRFMPVIWDLNESFGAFETIDNGGGGGPRSSTSSTLSDLDPFLRDGDETYPLVNVIFDNDRYSKMYIAHCRTILDENFVTEWYETEANTLQDLIAEDLADDQNAFYSTAEFTGNITSTQEQTIGLTELMEDRITFLQSEAAFSYTQPTISSIVPPTDATPYSTVTVTAEVSDANYVHLGYRYSKGEAFTKIEMYDDGNHEDGSADDGVYGVSFMVDESNTHYYIYAENDDAGIFSPESAQHEYYKISAEVAVEESTDVVINELMASNSTTQADQDGEYDDWIELYNNTNSEISLSGYYLTDDSDDIVQWAFPDTSIAANDYLIIWADKDEEQDGLHAEFKLSASGESLYLVNSEYTIVNTATFYTQTEDLGFARVPNGTGDFVVQEATYSADNGQEAFYLLNNGMTALYDSITEISSSDLSLTSTYDTDENITYTVTYSPASGYIENSDYEGESITEFTEQDLMDEKIRYVHDGSSMDSDSFTFDVSDGTNTSNDQSFTITVATEITSIEVVSAENEILVYPNPVSDDLNIVSQTEILMISVYSIDGSAVVADVQENGIFSYKINTGNLTTGTYFLQILTNEGFEVKRVIKY